MAMCIWLIIAFKSENKEYDIVELIENNPITRLSNTYQNKLITKIKNNNYLFQVFIVL